jgi:ribose transport system ATP-binding protein
MKGSTFPSDVLAPYIVEVRNVVKRFPGVVALGGASLGIRPGEVHALVGENGAGKSTLIKLLSGVYQPDEGSIYVKGKTEAIASTRVAQALGITTIYQERTLAADLSPIENIFLGREIRVRRLGWQGLVLNEAQMRRHAEELWSEFGGNKRDLLRPVSELGGLKQRLIEIIKALAFESSLVIMDEPTAQLPDDERDILLSNIRKMRDQGVAVLLVTHRLEDLFGTADRVTVFRDGQWIDTRDVADTSIDEIIMKMVGRDVGSMAVAAARSPNQPLDAAAPEMLRIEGFTRSGVLDNVSLTLRAGEVLGIGGLAGSGRTELARAIIGADPIDAGEIWVDEKKVRIGSPADAIRFGIFMVPEERKQHGIVAGFNVARNITISAPEKIALSTFIQEGVEKEIATNYVGQLKIKTQGAAENIENLSGGNQQKVLFARALFSDPRVIIIDEPTQGIDVGAKVEVYKLIRDFVAKGRSVIVISSELPELLGLSDRVLVMREGRKAGELEVPPGSVSQPHFMEMMQRLVIALATGGGNDQ